MTEARSLLREDARPPKSQKQPFYALHPLYQSLSPIPLQQATPLTLAPIAYSIRYAEAMSYLRALMARNEASDRALILTEDIISMNPAHYTVWNYRLNILKRIWDAEKRGVELNSEGEEIVESTGVREAVIEDIADDTDNEQAWQDVSDQSALDAGDLELLLWQNIEKEIAWLDGVSFKNLKNYQIWHHRHGLVDLLPFDHSGLDNSDRRNDHTSASSPSIQEHSRTLTAKLIAFLTSEQQFLVRILSLDTKNYHVWSYRQWLCQRYPSLMLPRFGISGSSSIPLPEGLVDKDDSYIHGRMRSNPAPISGHSNTYENHSEVLAMNIMVSDDVRNNSAWSHRYFLLFGSTELMFVRNTMLIDTKNLDQAPKRIILSQMTQSRWLEIAGFVDYDLALQEIGFVKQKIRLAPMNGSTWNYFRGIVTHAFGGIHAFINENRYSVYSQQISLQDFCEEFIGPNEDLWAEQYQDVDVTQKDADGHQLGEVRFEKRQIGVRSTHAIEWLSEVYKAQGKEERSRECLKALAEKWDTIRQNYWNYLLHVVHM